MQLTIAFDAFLPVARWGPLFHVLCLEHPRLTLAWQPVGFPTLGRSPLDNAEVALLVEPLAGPGLDSLTIDSSPIVAVMPVGHPLARHDDISTADILDEQFLDLHGLDPRWRAIWTLDRHRRAPANLIEPPVTDTGAGLAAIASGAAIATVPEWAANGLNHPGVVSVAAPIFDVTGACAAAMSVAGPISRMPPESLERFARLVVLITWHSPTNIAVAVRGERVLRYQP